MGAREFEYDFEDTKYYLIVESEEYLHNEKYKTNCRLNDYQTGRVYYTKPHCQRGQVLLAVRENEVISVLEMWLDQCGA